MLRRNIAGMGFVDQTGLNPSGSSAPMPSLNPAPSGAVYSQGAQADSTALVQAFSGAAPNTSGAPGASSNGAQIVAAAAPGIGTALLVAGGFLGVAYLLSGSSKGSSESVTGMGGKTGGVLIVGGIALLAYLWYQNTQAPAPAAVPAPTPVTIPGTSALTPIYQITRSL